MRIFQPGNISTRAISCSNGIVNIRIEVMPQDDLCGFPSPLRRKMGHILPSWSLCT